MWQVHPTALAVAHAPDVQRRAPAPARRCRAASTDSVPVTTHPAPSPMNASALTRNSRPELRHAGEHLGEDGAPARGQRARDAGRALRPRATRCRRPSPRRRLRVAALERPRRPRAMASRSGAPDRPVGSSAASGVEPRANAQPEVEPVAVVGGDRRRGRRLGRRRRPRRGAARWRSASSPARPQAAERRRDGLGRGARRRRRRPRRTPGRCPPRGSGPSTTTVPQSGHTSRTATGSDDERQDQREGGDRPAPRSSAPGSAAGAVEAPDRQAHEGPRRRRRG